ncbi:MAG TPA: amino acid ABC transporter permease [Actinomycetota bacterium]|jgi:polar amino acid transport system permease protein|nr:amino acid ABC transporter permease [Actinomycetota bacterium]
MAGEQSFPEGTPGVDPRVPGPGSRSSRILGAGTGGRSIAIALVSTILVFGGLAVLVGTSPGWPSIRDAFFDGDVFADAFPKILRAFRINVLMFVVAEVLVLVLAMLVAIMRSLPGPVFLPLRIMAAIYTDFFRGVPTILVIFLLGFGAPALRLQGVPSSDLFWGIVALTLVYTAYVAEVYRAGIESVHPSQVAAARSLGLTRAHSLRYVVVPQAVRRVIPPLLNDFIGLQKDTALVGALGSVVEGLRQAQILQFRYFDFTPFVALALIYLVITVPMTRFVDWLVERERRRRQGAATL